LFFADILLTYQKMNNSSRDSILRKLSDASTQTQDTVAFEINREDNPQTSASSKQKLP
jgi:hypothetical protein